MDKIQIENQEEKQTSEIEQVTSEEEVKKSIPKKFIYLVAAIIIIFIALLSYGTIKDYFSPPTGAITINDLFLKNLQGELPPDQGYMYNGFSFVLFDGIWYSEIQYENKNFQIPLHYGPKELENIPIKGKLNQNFDQDEVYLTFNPLESDDYEGVALMELAQNIAMIIHREPLAACDRNETQGCKNRPIITCEDKDKAVIYFLHEPGPEIELNGNCLILKGQEDDLVKAANRILYQWYGVME